MREACDHLATTLRSRAIAGLRREEAGLDVDCAGRVCAARDSARSRGSWAGPGSASWGPVAVATCFNPRPVAWDCLHMSSARCAQRCTDQRPGLRPGCRCGAVCVGADPIAADHLGARNTLGHSTVVPAARLYITSVVRPVLALTMMVP